MKKCPKCGARNDDQVKACSLCNTVFTRNSSPGVENYEPRLMQRGGKAPTHRGEQMLAKPDAVAPSTPAREDTRSERHYLLLTLGDPFKLETNVTSIVLGRDAGANVRLPSL